MKLFIVLLVAITLSLHCLVAGNVIGIDFATDAIKVALIQPGTPLEIVTNFQSKRKTPTSVAFYKGERLFGSDATALSGRKPETSIAKIYRMLGRDIDHPHVQEVVKKQFHPYDLYKNETTGLTSVRVDGGNFAIEELAAMMLQHVKDMTFSFGRQHVKDCVITVPSSFTQHEREAIHAAAEIAELNVLGLIEENTAAALNYATDRSFDQPKNVLYYNLGAGSLQVSVVQYSSYHVKEGSKNKTIGHFEVLGKAWDTTVGGFAFDIKLTELLADRFNEGWRKKASGKDKDLRDFIRPMTRLRIEANKVKEVLSANKDYPVRAEQLHADTDLNTKVTREEFEAACEDLFARLTPPIERALAMANLTIADVQEVELLGGAFRMPKVKKVLEDYFKPANLPLGQHLNGDESMALGAAFRAANLTTQFRVRKIGMTDISSFGIAVRLESLPEEEEAVGLLGGLFKSSNKKKEGETAQEKWEKATTLFPVKSAMPSKVKTVAFNHDQDIHCKIAYDDSTVAHLPEGTAPLLAVYNITGISAFAKESAEKGLGTPKVHLSFQVDNLGIAKLVKAEATVELPIVPDVSEAGSIESDAAAETKEKTEGGEETKDAEAGSKTTEEAAGSTETEGKDDKAAKDEKKTAADVKGKKKDNKKKEKDSNIIRRVLTVKYGYDVTVPPKWSPAMIAEARGRLRALNKADDERKAKAAAMNDLEAYIYKVKNRVVDEEDKLKKVSTEEQRQAVIDLANSIEEWLYDDGRDQTVPVYTGKQGELREQAEAIFDRYSELTARVEEVKKAKDSLAQVRTTMNKWSADANMTHITSDEIDNVLKLVQVADEWIEEKAEAQEKQSPFEKPVFRSTEVKMQLKPVALAFDKLSKKPKPVAPKVVVTEANSTTSADESITVEVNPDEVKVETEDAPSKPEAESNVEDEL